MIVREILSAEPAQMFFVERDYVVQQLAAGIADPTLRCTVLPRTADAGSDWLNPAAGQQFANSGAEFGIAVEDGIAERAGKREGFPQLLSDPIAGGMSGGIEVEDLAAAVLDDEETVEHPEGQGGPGEEVEGGDDFAMVVQEGEPALGLGMVPAVLQSLQVAGDGGLGNGKPELEEFTVNAGSAPGWVVRLHAADQLANLKIDGRSSGSTLP